MPLKSYLSFFSTSTSSSKTALEGEGSFKIVIAAGGSGGHLLPAEQLAEELQAQKIQVCFAAKGLQHNKNFRQKKFAFLEVSSGPLKKLHLLFKGFFQAWFFLRKYRPDVVVGFGSYHSFPVLLAAAVLRKKLVVFESNAILGQVNRLFANRAKVLALQFTLQKKSYANSSFAPLLPWSKSFQLIDQKVARQKLGLATDQPVLFIFGGSQGAAFLNDLTCQLAFFWKTAFRGKEKPFQIICLTGQPKPAEKIKKCLAELSINAYVAEYSQEMELLFSASNVVLSRSGSGTLSELIFTEKPALLVPFPFAKDNHQEINADFFEGEIQGGIKLKQSEIEIKHLSEKLLFLLEQEKSFQRKFQEFKSKVHSQKRKSLARMIQDVLEN